MFPTLWNIFPAYAAYLINLCNYENPLSTFYLYLMESLQEKLLQNINEIQASANTHTYTYAHAHTRARARRFSLLAARSGYHVIAFEPLPHNELLLRPFNRRQHQRAEPRKEQHSTPPRSDWLISVDIFMFFTRHRPQSADSAAAVIFHQNWNKVTIVSSKSH